ncbi:3-dehydroquinate synthase [Aliidiomarina minuta]|uniref:3-dehydroquinate synthase n=1 Tax=Aliidiomarina minuta TaxID=880057 RepID=A0A432W3F3_9GAMM|nr:3-dehydroquinate synthase [Aliidiomarina minuta]RUO23868.1 3-dehydroquinate synthase [Aliidiomarina minuta]
MQQITVQLGTRSYPISIGSGLLPMLSSQLKKHLRRQVFIITNTRVAELYLEKVKQALQPDHQINWFIMQDGEAYKNFESYQQALDHLITASYGRDCTVVALGGGVVGDLAGFVAASYQRGVDFVQLPTTLLSQVDSSVGGKTAINHPQGKNLVGAFHQPQAVVIDIDCLQTLPERELKAGLAEIIKYGIMADAEFFAWLETNIKKLLELDAESITYAIATSCQIKANVVAGDEREKGQRALLNLGHTFGHAIETASGYGNWLHGEAVAAGMAIAAQVAQCEELISNQDYQRILRLLVAAGLPVNAPSTISWPEWQQLMGRDKKVQAGQIRYVLPTAIGAAKITTDISDSTLQQCVAEVRAL